MDTLTDYQAWLDAEGIETAEEMLQAYRPVANNETGWKYAIKPARGASGQVILTGGENDLLLTEKSRAAFIKYMNSRYELGVEGQAAYEYAMAKKD